MPNPENGLRCFFLYSHSATMALLLFALILTSGCHKTKQPTPQNSKQAEIATHEKSKDLNSRTIAIPERSPVLKLKNVSADPNVDNWSTESFADNAYGQLKQITSLVVDGKQFNIAQELEHESFQAEKISLPTLNLQYENEQLQVERLVPGNSQSTSSFREFLSCISDGMTHVEQCRFKIFRIQEKSDCVDTTVRVRTSGTSNDGVDQRTMIWNCSWTKQHRPRILTAAIEDFERIRWKSHEKLFQDQTATILGGNESYGKQLVPGLNFWLDRLELHHGIAATSYHGISVADVNNDGLDDVFICQPGGVRVGLPNRLYLQQPDGTAVDASAQSGLDWFVETHCAIFVDFDNDGDQDCVSSTMAGLVFAENLGGAQFKPRVFKVAPESPAISLAAADFDNDGDLDVYACCYGRRASSDIMGRPVPYHDANNGSRNMLYRNDQKWRFKNVTKSVGLEQNNRRFSLACSWEDFDNDGDQDLYVANDFGRNNLYRNIDGQFTDIAADAGVEDMSAGMSVAWGDYDNNGQMDLYVSNMWSSAGNRISYQKNFLRGRTDSRARTKFQRHARGNSLFSNRSENKVPSFIDNSVSARVTMAGWAWSSQFVDVNNDSWQDLVVANGYITQENSKDL